MMNDGGYGNVRNRTIALLLDRLDKEGKNNLIKYLKDKDKKKYDEFTEMVG